MKEVNDYTWVLAGSVSGGGNTVVVIQTPHLKFVMMKTSSELRYVLVNGNSIEINDTGHVSHGKTDKFRLSKYLKYPYVWLEPKDMVGNCLVSKGSLVVKDDELVVIKGIYLVMNGKSISVMWDTVIERSDDSERMSATSKRVIGIDKDGLYQDKKDVTVNYDTVPNVIVSIDEYLSDVEESIFVEPEKEEIDEEIDEKLLEKCRNSVIMDISEGGRLYLEGVEGRSHDPVYQALSKLAEPMITDMYNKAIEDRKK